MRLTSLDLPFGGGMGFLGITVIETVGSQEKAGERSWATTSRTLAREKKGNITFSITRHCHAPACLLILLRGHTLSPF